MIIVITNVQLNVQDIGSMNKKILKFVQLNNHVMMLQIIMINQLKWLIQLLNNVQKIVMMVIIGILRMITKCVQQRNHVLVLLLMEVYHQLLIIIINNVY